MKNKKIITSILLCSALTGCANNSSPLKALNIKKTTDYLYEATLDYDFDYKIAQDYYQKYYPKLGGCSAITIGNVRGRNYDWEYSEGIEFVVRTTKTKDRHASIGISSVTDMTNEEAVDGKYQEHYEQYSMLPFLTLDGINDAGLYVNVNVVPFQSLGAWEMKNTDKEDDLCDLCGVRIVLDKCAYLEDIPKEFDKYDWFPLGNAEETHLMVTGPRSEKDKTVSTVVFEFVPFAEGGKTIRKLCVISNNPGDKSIVDNENRFYLSKAKNLVMTNFNLWQFDCSLSREEQLGTGEGSVISTPMGYERYETLVDAGGNRESVTLNEMQDIMRKVYFSNAYNLFQPNFWYSDYNFDKATMKLITEQQRNPYGDINKVYSGNADLLALIKYQLNAWNNRDRKLGATQGLWETIHTSIFDYTNQSFRVIPAEGNIFYEFKL